MTVIAAIKNRSGKIYIGADKRASIDWDNSQNIPNSKVVRSGSLVIGGAGDWNLLCGILTVFEPPYKTRDETVDQYIHYKLNLALREHLIFQGYADANKMLSLPKDSDASMLVAINGRLFEVLVHNPEDSNLTGIISASECALPYAIGSGALPAMSVLKSKLLESGYNTKKDLELSIQIACDISPGCGLNKDNKPDIVGEE